MTAEQQAQLERSPDFWWLRLRYALRDGDLDAAAESQRRLRELGIDIRFASLLSGKEAAPCK